MRDITYSTTTNEPILSGMRNSVLDTISKPKVNFSDKFVKSTLNCSGLIISQPADTDIAGFKVSMPAYEECKSTFKSEEHFTFTNRAEVLEYIEERPALQNLYKRLHIIIKSIFGDVSVHLSIFRDYEENWSNLRVEIRSDSEMEELLELEDKLFALIEKDKLLFAALEYVTISCG